MILTIIIIAAKPHQRLIFYFILFFSRNWTRYPRVYNTRTHCAPTTCTRPQWLYIRVWVWM